MSRRPTPPTIAADWNAELHLTKRERELVASFRAINVEAQDFILGTARHFGHDFPAQRPRLVLVAGQKGGKA